jgi:hypothetical protein
MQILANRVKERPLWQDLLQMISKDHSHRVITNRWLHGHHCCCCVRCIECIEMTIANWILLCCREVSNPANYRVFRRRFLSWCYSNRLITTTSFNCCYCHCSWRSGRLSFAMVCPFGVAIRVWQFECSKRKVNETTSNYTAKEKSSFSLSSFLQDSSLKATGLRIFPILKEWNKTAFDVWFYQFRKKC